MKNDSTSVDWAWIRSRARSFPEVSYEFVREGLTHTVRGVHGEGDDAPRGRARHVTGQQLCEGLRRLALERYGQLAGLVLHKWGLRNTEDFGVIVYSMIDRGEMRNSANDRFEDFRDAFDFQEAFAAPRASRHTA